MQYYLLLPHPTVFLANSVAYEDVPSAAANMPYTPLAAEDDMVGEEEGSSPSGPKANVSLSASDKWRLVRPLLLRYMLPLCKPSLAFVLWTPANAAFNSLRIPCECFRCVDNDTV